MKRLKILSIAILLLQALTVIGQEERTVLTGFVVNQDEEPVAGAQVCLMTGTDDGNSPAVCVTDENGHYLIALEKPVGPLVFVISAEGYPEQKYLQYYLSFPQGVQTLSFHVCNEAVFYAGQLATIFLPTTPNPTAGQYYRLDRVENKHLLFERELSPKADVPYLIIPDSDFRIAYPEMEEADKWVEQSFPEASFYGFYAPTTYSRYEKEGTYIIDKTPDCDYIFQALHNPNESGAYVGGMRGLITLKSAGNWTNVDWASHTLNDDWMNILVFHDSERDSTFTYTTTHITVSPPESAAFTGVVVGTDGVAVANACVRLKNADGSTVQETSADSLGHFLLPVVDKAVPYGVAIAAEGCPEQHQYNDGWQPFDFSQGSLTGKFILADKAIFKSGQRASIILPYPPDPSFGKFYKLEKEENGKIIFCSEPFPKADIPYVIIPDKDFEVELPIAEKTAKYLETSIPGISLRGSYGKQACQRANNEYTVLFDKSADCSYIYEKEHSQNEVGCTVGAMHAVLVIDTLIYKEISTSTVARKPNLYDRWIIDKLVELRDVTTDSGISPKGTKSPVSKIHDLQGRRLTTPPQRGVYVRDGRKVVSKCEKGAVLEIK